MRTKVPSRNLRLLPHLHSERKNTEWLPLVAFVAHLGKCGKIGLNVLLIIPVSRIMQLEFPLADARVMLWGGC